MVPPPEIVNQPRLQIKTQTRRTAPLIIQKRDIREKISAKSPATQRGKAANGDWKGETSEEKQEGHQGGL